MKRENTNKRELLLAAPFLLVLAVMSIVSFIIPLRPVVSYTEKRNLAQLPGFTLTGAVSGDYFEELSLWYSDTFPGREGWLEAAQTLSSFHGYGNIVISGDLPDIGQPDEIPTPTIPAPVQIQAVIPGQTEAAAETAAETMAAEQTEAVPETTEALVDQRDQMLLDAIIDSSSVIQIGGSAYNPVGFSQLQSDRYINAVSSLAKELQADGIRVASVPAITAVGIDVEESLLPQMRSVSQRESLAYLHGSMDAAVYTVNTYEALIAHKGEYLYFHTDHHWTALAAYYAYSAACETMGLTPANLQTDFDYLDQGEFQGSLAGKAGMPKKLTKDHVDAYIPKGNISMVILNDGKTEQDFPLIRDMREQNISSKYVGFLGSDSVMVRITNEDLPEDTGTALIIKDSFGNCFVPYFSRNYHTVIAIDYRKFQLMKVQKLIADNNITDVYFAPNMMSIQSQTGADLFELLTGYRYTQK